MATLFVPARPVSRPASPARTGHRLREFLVGALVVALLGTPVALAQQAGGFDARWATVGGGGKSTGGTFVAAGVVDPKAGSAASGGTFSIEGGYASSPMSSAAPSVVIFSDTFD